MKQADVVICGGGMVGLPLGLALAQGGLKTVVADAAPVAARAGPEVRWPGLGPGLCQCADADGAGGVGRIWTPHAQPIREILVTDGKPGQPASPFSLHFDAAEVGADGAGPYRREPPYPRRAVCGGGARSRIWN